MKFNKLFGIVLSICVLCLCISAVAAADDVDSHAVGADEGNLAVENNNGDVLGAGNSWYVKAGASGGDGSETSPYGDLSTAYNKFKAGDTIYVMDGTYKGNKNIGLQMTKDNVTIVSYDNSNPIFDAEQNDQIFYLKSNNAMIKGLTFINGYYTWGSALDLDGDNIRIDSCTFKDNIAQNANKDKGQGTIYIDPHENIVINNCIFEDNYARAMGGAIYNTAPNALIANCTFNNNRASNGGSITTTKNSNITNNKFKSGFAALGGEILCYGSYGNVIDNNSFEYSNARYGGAIMVYTNSGNNTISNNNFDHTHAQGVSDSDGGAVYLQGKNNVLVNNTFNSNYAMRNGGSIFGTVGAFNTTVDNCTFTNNNAYGISDKNIPGLGGAIYLESEKNKFINSEFVNNFAPDNAGAILIKNNDNLVENCTFDKNWAGRGGAIYIAEKISNHNITNTVINNCTFNDNGRISVQDGQPNKGTKGGAIYSGGIDTNVTNSKFNNNQAMVGGAILFERGHNFLENDTFTGNKAVRYGGGAISSTRFGDTINNCTFINNQAKGYGGAIGADYPTIINSKFIGNSAFHGGAICTILANVSNSEFHDNYADDGWYIVAATELIENNNVHPGQDSISLHHTKYMSMTYDSENGITHVDGYTAFCVEEDADAPKYGVMWEDLRFLQNSLSEEYVGEYLKILMFKYWNDESDYASFRDLINIFTDHDFKNSNNAIVNDVVSLYDSGFRVPTNGALKLNDDGTAVVYNFGEIIVPSSTQNVFVFTVNRTNLTVKKEVLTNPVVIGKQVDFNITVKNTGECNLTSVWINETGFSKGLAYDSFRSPFNWNYDSSKKLWILNETLGIGKIAYIILTFNVTDSGIMQNNVSVGFSNHTFANDTVDFPVYIPNMTVEKISLTPEVTVGMPAYFMIRITNTGECELSNINVTEMNSEGLAYQNFIDSTGKWIFIGSMEHPKWQYNGTLSVGRSAELMVVYNTLRGGTFTNVVAVDNNQTTGSGKNDTVIHEPMIKVEKITLTPKVPVGELTSFRIRVTNIGDCDLEEVYVKELKFDGLIYDHFTSVSNRWTFDGKDTWTYNGILAEGERSQFIVFFKTITVGNFTNIVVAGSNSTNETTAKNVTETFENKTDDNNTNNSDKSNNTDKSNNINGKNNSNTTSNVPKDSNKTDVSIKRATGNPLFALLAVLLMLGVSRIRKFKK